MEKNLAGPTGRAYGMKPPHSDPVLPYVGPGTPGGELQRRYWQPVALSYEANDLPKLIRRFGEYLILFRNKRGEAGLLYPRCTHTGASLLYGRVEVAFAEKNRVVKIEARSWMVAASDLKTEQLATEESR